MPRYEIKVPGQGTYEIESDTELTQAQAYSYALVQAQKSAEMSHPPSAPGASVESLTPGQSFTVGRTNQTPKEIAAALGGGNVYEQQGVRYWQPPPGQGDVRRINQPGLDRGDFARFAGAALPETAGGTAALAIPGVLPAKIAWAAGGAAAGRGLDELAQIAQGWQQDTPEQIMGQMALAGGSELLGGGLGLLGSKLLQRGVYRKGLAEPIRREVLAGQNFRETAPGGVEYPQQLPIDVLKQTGGVFPLAAGPIRIPGLGLPVSAEAATKMGNQVEALSGTLSQARDDLVRGASAATQSEFMLPPQAREAVNAQVEAAGRRAMARKQVGLETMAPSREAAAFQTRQGAKGAQDTLSSRVSEQYQGPLAQAVDVEKPVFDITPAMQGPAVPTLTRTEMVDSGLTDASGMPIEEAIAREIVATPAPQKVQRLRSILASLDPEQTNFEALKRIRSEAGKLLSNADPDVRGSAKLFYGDMTDVLKNPVNKAGTPRYLEEFENANLLNEWKMGILDDDAVKKMLAKDDTGKIISTFVANPDSMLGPDARAFISLMPENQQNMLRKGVRRTLLTQDDPAAAVRKLNDPSNPEPYNSLFRDQAERETFEAMAGDLTRFNNTPIAKVVRQAEKGEQTAEFALGQLKTPTQVRAFAENLSPTEKEGMATLTIDRMMQKALKYNEKRDVLELDPKTLSAQVRDAVERGTWDLLTPAQKKRVQGAQSYWRQIKARTGDVGTSLEAASTFANLRGITHVLNPRDIFRGLGAANELLAAKVLAKQLSSPEKATKMFNKLSRTPPNRKPLVYGALAATPLLVESPELADMFSGEGQGPVQ